MHFHEINGRKISSDMENPIDDILIHLSDNTIPLCTQMGITPNHVTIFRSILTLYTYYLLFTTCEYEIPIAAFMFCYFLDCLDGHLARKTNQVTVLGDYLDHMADSFVGLMFIVFMLYREYEYKLEIVFGFIVVGYLSVVHMNLQQQNYSLVTNKYGEELLDKLDVLHNFKPRDIMWTRYFGMGTMISTMAIIIYWIQTHCRV
jgi:phosphatidylglycerophosphate synthase